MGSVIPGFTGDHAGLKAGDVLLAMDGKPVHVATIVEEVRSLGVGQSVNFEIIREGKKIQVAAPLVERPRDPGNDNYTVEYSDVSSFGHRMRTIVTHPKTVGKHPGLMFIQGYSPVSYDFALSSKGLDAPILFDFANSGYVTMRVDKPGVGDSEGGPFSRVDYTSELDIYRQALKQLKAQPDVDPNDVFIFGHSMGGAFGPMVASEIQVKGIFVYGIAARTWHEYLLDITRYQGLLAGNSYADVDEQVREASRVYEMVFQDGKTPEQVLKEHPEWKATIQGSFPDGLFNEKVAKYWSELENTNFASYWAKVNTHVLAVWGESDFVTYKIDHQLAADVVNSVHPGWGRVATVPNSDHLFATWPSQAESMKHFGAGDFNPAFLTVVKDWIADIESGKD